MNISCRKATMLTIKKEANETSVFENMKLSLHFSICDGCKRFASQSKLIGENAQHLDKHTDVVMAVQKKIAIKKMLA